MCKSANRDFRTWKRSKRAKEFLKVYEKVINENKKECVELKIKNEFISFQMKRYKWTH